MSKAAIGRKLGLHPATVRKLANARSVEESDRQEPSSARISSTPYIEYLHRRWNEGERNADRLCSARSASAATREENWPSSAPAALSATGRGHAPRSRGRSPHRSARSPPGS